MTRLRRRLVPTLILLCGVSLAARGGAVPDLPAPLDVPVPPRDAARCPGGRELPAMSGTVAETAPRISAAGDMTFPDETLVVCGQALSGAKLVVWAEGLLSELEPVRTAHDRLVALVPKGWPVSTMLVWPLRDDTAGRPIRINGATVWWGWPARARAGVPGQTVKLMGKNLSLTGCTPVVLLETGGVTRELELTKIEPYCLEARLPALTSGTNTVYAHNGTGGRYGWSDGVHIQAVKCPGGDALPHLHVEAFGAAPDDGSSDTHAIERAVDSARVAGGGVVLLGPGTYLVNRPVVLESDVRLLGVGMGKRDLRTHDREPPYTVLKAMPGCELPAAIVELRGRRSSIADMTLENGNDGGGQTCVAIRGHDTQLQRCRVIMADSRKWEGGTAADRRPILTSAVDIDAPGTAQIRVDECEIHSCAACIQIGENVPSHNSDRHCPPSTDFVSVTGTVMRGSYKGSPIGTKGVFRENARIAGIGIYNGKNIIAEYNDFGGANRYAGLTLNRSIAVVNTSVRHCFFAHNRSIQTGNHASMYQSGELAADERALRQTANQGEQYIFHYHYPQGGLFDVVGAKTDEVTVTTENIEPHPDAKPSYRISWDSRGSRIINEVGKNSHWVLFICSGKGVGQYREISGAHDMGGKVWFGLRRPWRVVPDQGSRVVLMAAYRNNIVYDNVVDPGADNGEQKIHGVCFWYACFDNIVDGNTFRNTTSGVVYNSSYRNPTGWNMTRGNTIENTYGKSYDTSERAAAYVDHYRAYGSRWPEPKDRIWLEIGNVARDNRCRNMHVAAYLHTRDVCSTFSRTPDALHPEGGIMMCVLENNEFLQADHPIHLGCPAHWPVVRNNRVTVAGQATQEIAFECPEYIREPVLFAEGRVLDMPLPFAEASDDLLRNGGFEARDAYDEFPAFWHPFDAVGSEADLLTDESQPFQGRRCVTVAKKNGTNYSGFRYIPRLALRGGKRYRLSGAVRGSAGHKASLVFMMRTREGEYLGYHTSWIDLSADWTEFTRDFQAKPETAIADFEIRAHGSAYTVAFDNLSLCEVP